MFKHVTDQHHSLPLPDTSNSYLALVALEIAFNSSCAIPNAYLSSLAFDFCNAA